MALHYCCSVKGLQGSSFSWIRFSTSFLIFIMYYYLVLLVHLAKGKSWNASHNKWEVIKRSMSEMSLNQWWKYIYTISDIKPFSILIYLISEFSGWTSGARYVQVSCRILLRDFVALRGGKTHIHLHKTMSAMAHFILLQGHHNLMSL